MSLEAHGEVLKTYQTIQALFTHLHACTLDPQPHFEPGTFILCVHHVATGLAQSMDQMDINRFFQLVAQRFQGPNGGYGDSCDAEFIDRLGVSIDDVCESVKRGRTVEIVVENNPRVRIKPRPLGARAAGRPATPHVVRAVRKMALITYYPQGAFLVPFDRAGSIAVGDVIPPGRLRELTVIRRARGTVVEELDLFVEAANDGR
ncbi:hypothetical protein [Lysobacter sp. A289]